MELFTSIVPEPGHIGHNVLVLMLSALLGAALGIVRPVRTEIVPRSPHVVQAQILLAIVGAMIIVVVAESLGAGVRHRRGRRPRAVSRAHQRPKDAGVMLVALAVGLTVGSGLFLFATIACVFVLGVLWLLESLEPEAHSRFNLKIAAKNAVKLRPEIEHALDYKGVTYELRGSSADELHYEVTVPFRQKIRKLSKLIRSLDSHDGTSIEWEIKKYKTLKA